MKFTRRQVLKSILGGFLTSFLLPGCNHIKRRGLVTTRKWKEGIRGWWIKRQAARASQRKTEREEGKRPDVPTPQPFLFCGKQRSSRGWLGEQIIPLALNEKADVAFVVENRGNAATWTCYVEMYEGPFVAYHIPYTELRLTDRKIISVHPGEAKEVALQWQRTRSVYGSISIRCFDPVLDPGLLTFEQYDRKNSGISWEKLGE